MDEWDLDTEGPKGGEKRPGQGWGLSWGQCPELWGAQHLPCEPWFGPSGCRQVPASPCARRLTLGSTAALWEPLHGCMAETLSPWTGHGARWPQGGLTASRVRGWPASPQMPAEVTHPSTGPRIHPGAALVASPAQPVCCPGQERGAAWEDLPQGVSTTARPNPWVL